MGIKFKVKMIISWAKTAILFLSLLIMKCDAGIITGNLQMSGYNISPLSESFNLPISMDLYNTKKSGEWSNQSVTWDRVYLGHYNPQGSKFIMKTQEAGCFSFDINGDSGEILTGNVYYRFIGCEGKYIPKCCITSCECGCECQCDASCCNKGLFGRATMQISMVRFANSDVSNIIFNLTTENYPSTVPEPSTCILLTLSSIIFYWKKIINVLFTR